MSAWAGQGPREGVTRCLRPPWPLPPEARLGDPGQRRSPGQVPGVGRPAGPQLCERLISWGRGRGLSLPAGLPAIDEAYRLARVLASGLGPPGPRDFVRVPSPCRAWLSCRPKPLPAEVPGLRLSRSKPQRRGGLGRSFDSSSHPQKRVQVPVLLGTGHRHGQPHQGVPAVGEREGLRPP